MAAAFTLLAWAANPFTTQAQLPATSWETVASMPGAVAAGASLVFNGKIYVFAGYDDSTPIQAMYVYDPTLNTWETLAGPSFGRGEVAAVEINGLFYLAGGYGPSSGGFFTALAETEVFDPLTESWSTLASMPSGRSVVYSGKIGEEFYVMGGWPGTQNTVTKYNVQTGAWSAAPPLPSGRHNTHGACSIGGRIHCIGGKNDVSSEIYNDHYVYDGITQSWVNAAPLPIQAWGGAIGHTDEYIFHTGGVNAGYGIYTPSYDQCYVYSVANDTWFEWVAMSQKRSGHASVVLDGYLYVIGGSDEANNRLNSVERIALSDVCAEPEACNYLENGACNFPEAGFDCAGNCMFDFDLDGICDIGGCTDPTAINYDPTAVFDDGSCESGCPLNQVVLQIEFTNVVNGVSIAITDLGSDTVVESSSTFSGNGSLFELPFCLADGCYSINVQPALCVLCNQDDIQWTLQFADAVLAGGTPGGGVFALNSFECQLFACTDPTACNFNQEGECVFAESNLDCSGNCLNDCNNNGVCDENEVLGCTYTFACNYNPAATTDDGTCTVAQPNYDCAGNCLLDLNNNGLCDLEEVAGCTNIDAINYNAEATLDDGSCTVTCKGDFNNDGEITATDLLSFLAAFGNQCTGAGCMDPAGCNYDPNATFDLDYCEYPAEFFNCDGTCINDADGDGICDELEVAGCTDPEAGNYNPDATDDDGSCASAQPQYPAGSVFCNGTPTEVVEVLNPATGRIWMDRNLGASQAATSSTDEAAYGDLYQWGRGSDGHQCRNSATTTTLSSSDQPGHGAFIVTSNSPFDWRSPQNDNLWQGVNGVNNPCPSGFRVPTVAELDLERLSWSNNNSAGAFASPLKMIRAGNRNLAGELANIASGGFYWSNMVSATSAGSFFFGFSISSANVMHNVRASGFSVRCIKD